MDFELSAGIQATGPAQQGYSLPRLPARFLKTFYKAYIG
jgi:hypothetical protein